MSYDLCLRNTRPRGGEQIDIAIADGRIVEIGPDLGAAATDLDAAGTTTLPGFVNVHLHVDKALTAHQLPPWPEGTFEESIDLTLDLRRGYTHEDLLARGEAVLGDVVTYGTTALRAFADVGTVGGLTAAKALIELRDRWRDRIEIQVCAFPQEGLLRDPGAEDLLVEAMDLGCDVVGSFPWYELSNVQAAEHIAKTFEIARRFEADLHAFVDDEPIAPSTRNLEQLALTTIEYGWQGRVTASHACGLASYDDFSAERTILLVKDAEITVCANSHLSLVSKCERAPEPIPRGITRVRELRDAGVNVVCAQDDIADPYYPFGRGDMLEVASFMAHTAQLYRPQDTEYVLDAVTVGSAKAMRLADYGLEVGARADLVCLAATGTATELLRVQPPRRWVIRGGRLVARSELTAGLVGEQQASSTASDG